MKRILFTVIFSVFALTAFPQWSLVALQYSVGFGTGDMKDYIGKTSWRGFTFDYRSMVQSNIGVGSTWAGTYFTRKCLMPFMNMRMLLMQASNGATAIIFLSFWLLIIMSGQGEMVSAYAGLGAGTMYSLQNTDMGTYTFEKDAWHFALRPELGVLIEAAPGSRFQSCLKYYYGFKAGDLPAQAYFTVNVGFVFTK